MGKENKSMSAEKLGLQVPLGQTVILASFPLMSPDPAVPHIDVTSKRYAAWLTTPFPQLGTTIESIINPQGLPSPMLLRWEEDGVRFYHYPNRGLRLEPVHTYMQEEVVFDNLPEGGAARLVYQPHTDKGLIEHYTVLQLPGIPTQKGLTDVLPYIHPLRLMSGSANRGIANLATKLLAIRITDRSELPFGRNIPPVSR
jgi:hypothetical protein